MALIGAILVEIKTIEIVCKRSLREGDRHALNHSMELPHTRQSDDFLRYSNSTRPNRNTAVTFASLI